MTNVILFLRISYYVLITPFLIHTKKLTDLCEAFTPKKSNTKYKNEDIIRYTAFLVNLRIPTFRNLCLKKCLILYKFLRENGLDVSINIGVTTSAGNTVAGHSWLTLKGKPFYLIEDEKNPRKFELLYVFPAKDAASAAL